MKRPGLPPRTSYIARSRIKPKKRKPSEFARIYGSKKRVEWIKSLRCSSCGVVGYSQNAHTENGGMGRKADHTTIVPLCGPHDGLQGCHADFDQHDGVYSDTRWRAVAIAHAATVQSAWLRSQEGAP